MKYLIRVIVAVIIVGAIFIGSQIYGYSSLKTDFNATEVSPKFNADVGTVISSLVDIVEGNYLAAVSSYVQGLQVEGVLAIKNNSFLPLYLPSMQHQIEINGTQTEGSFPTSAMWIAPEGSKTIPISLVIDKTDLPALVLNVLANGGNINITIESSAAVAGFTITKTSIKQENLSDPISSYSSSATNSEQSDISEVTVTSYSFSPNPINLGSSTNANISLSGGPSGTYTLIILKDIALAPDQQVANYSFNYNGTNGSNSFSFTPSTSGSFHMSLAYNGSSIWSQPDDSTRVTVTNPSTPALSVNSYSFSPNPIILGNSTNANISLSSGSAGTYTLSIWMDISLAPDQEITSYTFTYNGGNTTQSFSFTPSTAGSYYMELALNGTNLWSQPDDSTRVTVTNPSIPSLTVNSYSFSPNPIILGNSTNASISLSGGSAGTYTLSIWKDISLAPDQEITSYTLTYNGSNTAQSFSFTPSATGSYYMELALNGTNLWSQPDDTTRVTVSSVQTTITTQVALSIVSYSFSPNPIILGSSTNATISLSGGSAGTYTLSVWKDISLAPDQEITSYNLTYNGINTTQSFSFTPSATGSYYMELALNGTNLWSQPNDTSRITVSSNIQTTPTTTTTLTTTHAALSITSYSFSPNPITIGNSTNANISLSGGSAGTYTLSIWKDISLAPDQEITSYNLAYNGISTAQSFSFTPSATGSYYMELALSGTNLWSQPDDTTRVTVSSAVQTTTTTHAALSIMSYSFSPNPITHGNSTNANLSLSGGTAGTYTLSIWKDISLAPDQEITSYNFTYNGTSTTQSFSFTPSASGSYYMELSYNGTTLWSQPNDTTRVKVN